MYHFPFTVETALTAVFRFLIISCFFCTYIFGQTFELVPEGPVHEAYVTRITPSVLLEAIGVQPPSMIMELQPDRLYSETEWIPGYWSWMPERNDFIWVSGIWRRPPPGKVWISGLWKHFDEGWVWVSGFWSAVYLNELTYLDMTPPDPLEDDVLEPSSSDSFWMSGYWLYSESDKQFTWSPGSWQKFVQNWVLVPAHYIWRAEGYVFIPAYWDWPYEELGHAYYPVNILFESMRMSYKPETAISPDKYIEKIGVEYPDYLYFFQHHTHFHQQFWEQSELAAPWWSWPSWWALSWNNQWGAWWWYTHPGYPQPLWMTPEFADSMPPPSEKLLVRVKSFKQNPFIITPNGVVAPHTFFQAATSLNKGKFQGKMGALIVSSKSNQVQKIQEIAQPPRPETHAIRPGGIKLPREDTKKGEVPFPIKFKTIKKEESIHLSKPAAAPKIPDLSKLQKPQVSPKKIEPWRPYRIQEIPLEKPESVSKTKKIEPIKQEKVEEPVQLQTPSQRPSIRYVKPNYQTQVYPDSYDQDHYEEYPAQYHQQIRIQHFPQSSYPQHPRTYQQIHRETWSQYWYHKHMQEQRNLWFRREQEMRRNYLRSQGNPQRRGINPNQNPQRRPYSKTVLKRYPANPVQNALGPNRPYVPSPANQNQGEPKHD